MSCAFFDVLALTAAADNLLAFWCCHSREPPYFFLFAIVLRGPLRVRAFVFERWPLTGSPFL